MSSNVVLILAGNHSEAKYWAESEKLSLSNVRYVAGPETLRGYSAPNYVVIGSFWQRRDAQQCIQAMNLARGVCINMVAQPPAPQPVTLPVAPMSPSQVAAAKIKARRKKTEETPSIESPKKRKERDDNKSKFLFKKIKNTSQEQ